MAIEKQYEADVACILSHQGDLGGELWTTPDKRILNGSPFSALECIYYLLELGMDVQEPLLQDVASMIFTLWKEDGRFKVYPKGGIYPCQSAIAVEALCYLGYANDPRIQKSFQHFLETQHTDGGWRCKKFSFGHGPETEFSNPNTTLVILNGFRHTKYLNNEVALDRAVESLLDHWTTRKPLGPCHYGIGKLFKQTEYPFRNYNIFVYVYVLSFYTYAKRDPRFLEALHLLEANMVDGQIVVERIVPKLSKLNFCKKGEPSVLATKRYHEILENLAK